MSARQLLCVRSSQPENIYGRFTAEILRSEGLNGFEILDLDKQAFPELAPDDLLVLTRCFLTKAEMDALQAGVRNGARVVMFQPQWTLADRFGWSTYVRVQYPGWIAVRPSYPGAGQAIQTHVPVAMYKQYQGHDCEVFADIVAPDGRDSGRPAIVRQREGQGEVVLFFYDLPEAIARIRFGNPDLVSLLTCGGWGWPHACEMFEGHVDDRRLHLPQADFHGQLLAAALTAMAPYPLARFWYYPKTGMRAAAVFQSDDDGSTPDQFRELAAALRRHNATGSFYLMRDTALGDEEVAAMHAAGHTFAPHVAFSGKEELYFEFPRILEDDTQNFKRRYGHCGVTLQSHCAPWMGYMAWVPAHIASGYRLLFAYMSIPTQRLMKFMCGSGRPMRFYDRQGTTHDCWQQPLVIYDDTSIESRVRADPRPFVAEFETLLRGALDVHHTTIAILSHPVSFATYSRPYIEACFDLLVAEGVPIFNGDEWCAFLGRRDQARIALRSCGDDGLCYVVSHLTGSLPFMIPQGAAPRSPWLVFVNGMPAQSQIVRRWGVDYLAIQLDGKADGSELIVELRVRR
jgi:hypothetical protein